MGIAQVGLRESAQLASWTRFLAWPVLSISIVLICVLIFIFGVALFLLNK